MKQPQQQLAGEEEARKAFDANCSNRYLRLNWLESWSNGTQYAGRDSWWSDDRPLWERAPCVQYPVVQIAVDSNVDLVLGESRFPELTMSPGEDEGDEENGLDEDDSSVIDRFIREYHRLCHFRSHCREAFGAAQACGTAVAIHGVRQGVPFADLLPAKWCEPKFGPNREIIELEVRYPYLDQYKRPDGKWAVRARLYRRVIDAVKDTTFLPAEADPNGTEPSWQVDRTQVFEHGYGFCPVVWYAFMKGCVPVNVVDGKAIHANHTDEIEAHDVALSQRHRGALLSEPQPYEIGVQPGYNPTEEGRTVLAVSTLNGGAVTPDNPVIGSYGDRSKKARKKGPGYVWQYEGAKTEVEVNYLTYPGEALQAQNDNAADLRMKLQEALAVVLLGPDEIKGFKTLSGKALETLKRRQLDRCDQYRSDIEDHFLGPSVNMQLRIAAKLGAKLRVPGAAKAAEILKKFEQPDVAAASA